MASKAPVDKTFRVFAPDQDLLFPPSLDDWLPAEHLARFVAELVDEHLDLSRIHGVYTEVRGGPPYDPRLMVRILLYGYTTGVRSSRKLEAACVDVVAFRWLAAGSAPDYRAIARFRKRHLSALGHLFVQALALCQAAGMVSLGRVALDGTKVRANASKRKAMSYARMTEKEKVLAGEVSALLAEAERIDTAEDKKFGKNRRGDELPEELRRRETRLAAIREAKAALEAEAAQAAREHAEAKARERGDDDDTAAEKGTAAAEEATPKPKSQRNFTDPESKIMLTGDGAFHQCYNAQAVVDSDHQVIVATELGTNASDVMNLISMTEQTLTNTGQVPGQMLADAGYCSADNLDKATQFTATHGTEFFIATGRRRRDEPTPAPPRGRIPNNATGKQRMARKLTTKKGHAVYARRKAIVEPVFGQMSTLQNAKALLLRGLDQARGEWLLLAACHNLRKLHGHIGITGLTALPA
ncbi:IS1182 family transposase [Mycolicibacterium frederiksbergense]|uniref:IS1182 family transposase n=1 Tax=Mycolicibacterium frederiksbergense TaxID=117567 RepID=A0A6H0S6J1_9MYCO|nr:IS1182 family transposase [Mycolicibacterium frederiksbergense]QIV79882.1 IS1182 family transposase [Mycolicibacterium frederiksbergense]QIV79951.1 IS1182 family transposase [Mycolicibacterium frederiksbergense]QIV81667.1 IS1182 family transposase [Mycolicibacterium frederiksbergense]QIV84164.1 IS1182 family transposase [Mycolicibacterium frederiksbergense]